MTPAASLHPVSGDPLEIDRLLAQWLAADDADPLVVSTSGSTGAPKRAALSRSALLASARATHDRLGGPGQWLLALPVHHVAGLQVLIRSWLADTQPVLLSDHPDLASATRALQSDGQRRSQHDTQGDRQRPTLPARRYLAAVPTQLHRWLASPASTQALTTYDAVLVGGGPADPDLLSRARHHGIRVVTTYGMTETCGGCVYDGVPLDGVAVALDRESRIRIAGPVLFDGYVGRPDLTAEVCYDDWFITEDLGCIDADGRLEVLGRVDEVVVSGGVNVPLNAVRRRLAALPGVAAAEVLGLPDPEWGQRVVAVLVLVTGAAEPDLAAVRDFVAAVHPRSWAPRDLVVRHTLPLLASGKVDRVALAHELAVRR